jgi:tetratricopeptide (TPR) repeat protein
MLITGQVFIEDGSAITSPISIVGGCRGAMQLLGYTDMQGHFAIDSTRSGGVLEDASSGASRNQSLCEIAARLEGYRSSSIDLTGRGSAENPEVGTILLHRVGEQEGSTVSLTSLQAPKSARRAFDKGMASFREDRLDDAAKQFDKAVTLYPKYADAWYRLGHVQIQQDNPTAGRASFNKAIAADPKLVPPYVELAGLCASAGQWREAADASQRAIRLDPFSAPAVYFFNSLANYNLQNWDASERSARKLQELDPQHHYLKINRILGALLAAKSDYAGAADQLRDYLKFAGDVKDAAEVRAQLAQLDTRLAAERNR